MPEQILSNLYTRDSDDAFRNAVKKGLNNPDLYSYMYTKNGKDFFKNIETNHLISYKMNYKVRNKRAVFI